MIKKERVMTIGIKSSLSLAPPKVIRHDLEELRRNRDACIQTIKGYKQSIKNQLQEQKELRSLAINPGPYNAESCRKAADRADDNIMSIEATIKKERAKIKQLDHMIKVLEERLCLSEQISQSTGNPAQE